MAKKSLKPLIVAKVIRQTRTVLVFKHKDNEFEFEYINPFITAPEDHYVYVVLINDEILYIGKGKGERYKHTQSLSTHSSFIRQQVKLSREKPDEYRLRTYVIFHGRSENNALYLEDKYIRALKPPGNIDGNPLYRDNKAGRQRLATQLKVRGDVKHKSRKSSLSKADGTIKRVKKRKQYKQEYYKKNSDKFSQYDHDRAQLLWLKENGF